jgi:hypothetical protein
LFHGKTTIFHGKTHFFHGKPPIFHGTTSLLVKPWHPWHRFPGAPMASPLSSPRARSSSRAAFRCQCLERTFARLDEAYPAAWWRKRRAMCKP